MRAGLFAALLLLATGCERPSLTIGGVCALNSDCGDPLVCRLDRCRRQCIDSRDCGAGLLCLRIGTEGGVCQLEEERVCAFASECEPLVCRFGTCTTECVEDRDCPPGASCEEDVEGGGNACVEPISELCVYDSDCPDPTHVCNDDQRCVPECVTDRDCPAPAMCVASRCQLPDGG